MCFSQPFDAQKGTAEKAELTTSLGWRFTLLAAVANAPVLRRHVGRQRLDALLAEIAARIAAILPRATVSVSGQDQVELAFAGSCPEDIDTAMATLAYAFEDAVDVDGEAMMIELALGGAAAMAPHHDEVRLIEEAELALAASRTERRPVSRMVSEAIGSNDRIALALDLRRALTRNELFLQYQPKLHLRRQQVSSVEALIRWRHPTRGLVLPSDFIPLAEESRDIVDLTLWTIRQVIKDQRTLTGRGHELPVFVNIAGVLLSNERFVWQVSELIQGSGAKIGFEITETSVIRDPASAIANLQSLAAIGISIAIDDYGAGLSSLAYLKQLPARELKIDKLFVTQLTSSHRDPLIVRSTIDLAHAMEMEVVAEGVETEASLALLSVMGCDMAQGYLISRPVGLNALITYLEEDRHLASRPEPHAVLGRLRAWHAA